MLSQLADTPTCDRNQKQPSPRRALIWFGDDPGSGIGFRPRAEAIPIGREEGEHLFQVPAGQFQPATPVYFHVAIRHSGENSAGTPQGMTFVAFDIDKENIRLTEPVGEIINRHGLHLDRCDRAISMADPGIQVDRDLQLSRSVSDGSRFNSYLSEAVQVSVNPAHPGIMGEGFYRDHFSRWADLVGQNHCYHPLVGTQVEDASPWNETGRTKKFDLRKGLPPVIVPTLGERVGDPEL